MVIEIVDLPLKNGDVASKSPFSHVFPRLFPTPSGFPSRGFPGVLGVFRGAPRPVHRGAQGAEAVRVGRRDVQQRHVGADQATAEEQRQVAQVDGT